MTSRLVALLTILLLLPKAGLAQSNLRNALSVRPVPGLSFDAYWENVSSQRAMASVVAELSALIRDAKALPGDALLLALLLGESGDDARALAVLRQNAQRHPADRMSLAALARECADEGFADEQEAALAQLYQLPAPPHQRLECLRVLAFAKQSHGRLRELRDALVKQQAQKPNDAYGWLELAVVQTRAGEDAESRRCVYEASKLRTKDVLLLGEIAQREAGFGFITEALGTLDVADKVARSGSTEMLRCLIQLGSGEQAKALATLAGFTLPADADLELVRTTADALAQVHAWSEAVRLLDQAIMSHATDYRLHYLRAVALEEKGDRDAAVTAFISMIGMATEMPADESHWFGRRYRRTDDIGHSMEGLALPSGTLGLMQSQAARQSAYYRLGDSVVCICYTYTQVDDAPAESFIALPQSLTAAKHYAAAHLRRLLPCVAAGRRTEAEKALVAGGLDHPEVLLDAAGIQAPGMLSRRPRDLALHATRLLSGVYGESFPLEVIAADVDSFRDAFPQLAFLAACRAYHATLAWEAGLPAPTAQPDSAAAWRVVALNLAAQVPACPQVIDALLSLMSHRYGPRYGHPAVAASDEDARILSRAVDLALRLPAMSQEARDHVMTSVVQAAIFNDDLPDAIRLVRELAKTSAPQAVAPPSLTLGEPVGAPLPMPLVELGITNPVLAVIAANSSVRDMERLFPEPKFSKVRALVAQVPEADARRALELFIGDYSGIDAEIKLRLAKPQPTLADHLLAAWRLPSPQDGSAGVLKHLAAASALTRDAAQLRIIDHTVLNVVRRYQEKLSDQQEAFVLASIQRLRAVELHPAFAEAASSALNNIRSVVAVEQASQSAAENRQAQYANDETMPYSRSAAYTQRQAREKETTARLVAALKARDLPAIAAFGGTWPYDRQNNMSYSRERMLFVLGGQEAFDLLVKSSRPAPASGVAEQLRYAESLKKVDESAAALQIYTELAEQDEHAFLPRLYAASQLAEQDPDKALAFLRLIRLESALAGENGVSPVAKLAPERGTASHRVAVARLVTRWINSMQKPLEWASLLDRQTCASLIQMIQRGEREDYLKFPDLYRAKDGDGYFIPAGPGAVAMKQARQAHDELCRAMLRLPQAQPTALAALASLVIKDGGDLSECARIAAAMLRDPQARTPLREWEGERFAGRDCIALPSPMTILVRHAAQQKDFTSFETDNLPLIEQALGTGAATRAGLYAQLFSVTEPGYPAAAAAWLAALPRDSNHSVRNLDEVLNVWQQRALRVDLTGLLLNSYAGRSQLDLGNVPEILTRYITLLIADGREDEVITFAKTFRDEMISSDAGERRRLIVAWQKQQARYRSDERELYRRHESEEKLSHVYSFASWLKYALRDPKLVCLLPLGMEEGLLGGPDELYQLCHEMLKPEVLRSPDAGIALSEQLGFLADAHDWHNYELAPSGDSYTWISTMTEKLRDAQDTGPIRQMLASRKPQTLGSEIFAALLAHSRSNLIEIGKRTSTDKRDELLPDVLTRRKAELAAIQPTQRRAFSLLLRTELPGYPDVSKLDAGLAAALQPFLDAEADELVSVLDRLLAAREWIEVGMNPREFAERFPATLAQATRRHPAKVEQVFRHACELLRKTPEDEQQRLRGDSGDTPIARFIWFSGQVPQLLGTCMSMAESEKLAPDPSWTESFTSKLTDYELMRNRDHVAAIFTNSPLIADAAHFNDFALLVRNNYDGVTLLDKVVTALNHDDATAVWLHQRLKAAPEQTFGIRLTLALLDSAAPIRKIKGYSNTARRDPAPLIAFSENNAKEFAQLSPAAASVVRTLLDRYLKPPAIDPDKTLGPLQSPPPSLR